MKRNFLLLVAFCIVCYSKAQYSINYGNTTYGGLVKDGACQNNLFSGQGYLAECFMGGGPKNNTGFGYSAFGLGSNSSGTCLNNTAIGTLSMNSLTGGNDNTALGMQSLSAITNEAHNTGVGSGVMQFLFGGDDNTAMGYNAMIGAKNCSRNTAVGWSALNGNTGWGNTVLGYAAGGANVLGQYNTAIGYQANTATGTGSYNITMGFNAGTALNTGSYNIGIGYEALFNGLNNNTSKNNIAIGANTLQSITAAGDDNVAIGTNSMQVTATGQRNVAVGTSTLLVNTSGSFNVGVGSAVLATNTTGNDNTALGFLALDDNAIGNNNVAVGYNALTFSTQSDLTAVGADALENNATGQYNTATGYQALLTNTTGSHNTAVGNKTLYHNNGSYNSALGDSALAKNTTGSQNSALGCLTLFKNTTGTNNTAVGYEAMFGNVGNITGNDNIGSGFRSMYDITTGMYNAAYGDSSLFHLTTGTGNSATGNQASFSIAGNNYTTADGFHALYSNVVSNNTAVGAEASFSNITGPQNTAVGYQSLYKNTGGGENTAMGYQALYNNNNGGIGTGNLNSAFGDQSLYHNTTGSYNTGCGYSSGFNVTTGTNNTAIGYDALNKTTKGSLNTAVGDIALENNLTGSNNTALGYNAGPGVGYTTLNFATAIGSGTIVTTSNTMLLGNNTTNVGIGMSNFGPIGPSNKLEISAYSNSVNTMECAPPIAGSTFIASCGGINPTGYSGLQFRDLTDASVPYPYAPNHGFLTLDDAGNVVYMAGGGGTSIGTCSTPTTLPNPGGGAYDLGTNGANFYFQGQGIHDATVTNVLIGTPVGNCTTPRAKLEVLQASGTFSSTSVGIGVVNTDQPPCFISPNQPSAIGIASVMPYTPSTVGTSKVAGWFQADLSNNCCHGFPAPQYAIYVPLNGGNVAIGYQWSSSGTNAQTCPNVNALLDVNGTVNAMTGYTSSDSTIKTNVQPIAKLNALSVLKKLQGVSFKYIDSVIKDSGVAGTHYGFIAQKVQRILPSIVKTNTNNGRLSLGYTEIIPWLVEGTKQLDSLHLQDSIKMAYQQSSIDSLRNILKSIQSCLSTLCNSDTTVLDSVNTHLGQRRTNTNVNTQNVTLSNSAILYQNAPNPFGSGGTKINYFLPENTIGASMIFLDSYGNKIKEVQLTQTGMGTLNVNPNQLTEGIYTYSLVINGNIMDTKKMVYSK